MKKSKYTDEQIAFALKQAELGTSVDEVCRKMAISDATFYNWRKKYGGLGPSEVRRLRQLEEENVKLKRLVADLSLDKAMLQDVCWQKNSKAFPQAYAGGGFDRALWRESIQGVRAAAHLAVAVQLPLTRTRCASAGAADQGDRGHARALRLSPCARAVAAGRLAR